MSTGNGRITFEPDGRRSHFSSILLGPSTGTVAPNFTFDRSMCPLCDSGTSAAGLKNELGADSKPRRHVNERVDAEEVNTATHQVANPGLGDTQTLSGVGLLQATRPYHLLQVHHQFCADLEVLGLLG